MPEYMLTKIVQEVLLDGAKPAKQLAKEIGKPYSTMLREANPYDTSAKVGIETLLDIMKASNSVKPLQYMAEQLGYRLVPSLERGQPLLRDEAARDAFTLSVSA